MLAFYTDDFVHEDVPLGVVHRGKDELRRFAETFFTNQPDFRMEVEFGFLTDTAGAAEWTTYGTFTAAALTGTPGTDKPYVARAASVFALRDGKIARQADYWDMLTIWRRLGLLPDPPHSP